MARGRSVRLYLAEGSATGILTAEIVNWTGHVLAGPRARLEVALGRAELARTGIYLLVGDAAQGDLPAVYVGEGDSIGQRLRAHAQDETKDFWDRFVAVTSKDMNLTKAHVRFLEARLIAMLTDARQSVVTNRTAPEFERLPEADVADMEGFIEELELILPVIGIHLLRRPRVRAPQPAIVAEPAPRFVLVHEGRGIDAVATEEEGEFVLLAGSRGSLHRGPSFHDHIALLRDQAVESGRAVAEEGCLRLVEDIAFSSPSAAAVFLFGTSRNGRTDWLVEGGAETYGAFKTRRLAQVPTA